MTSRFANDKHEVSLTVQYLGEVHPSRQLPSMGLSTLVPVGRQSLDKAM